MIDIKDIISKYSQCYNKNSASRKQNCSAALILAWRIGPFFFSSSPSTAAAIQTQRLIVLLSGVVVGSEKNLSPGFLFFFLKKIIEKKNRIYIHVRRTRRENTVHTICFHSLPSSLTSLFFVVVRVVCFIFFWRKERNNIFSLCLCGFSCVCVCWKVKWRERVVE